MEKRKKTKEELEYLYEYYPNLMLRTSEEDLEHIDVSILKSIRQINKDTDGALLGVKNSKAEELAPKIRRFHRVNDKEESKGFFTEEEYPDDEPCCDIGPLRGCKCYINEILAVSGVNKDLLGRLE